MAGFAPNCGELVEFRGNTLGVPGGTKGRISVGVEGCGQRQKLPNDPKPVSKTATVRLVLAAKNNEATKDALGLLFTGIKSYGAGPEGALISTVIETVSRFHLISFDWPMPVTDWTVERAEYEVALDYTWDDGHPYGSSSDGGGVGGSADWDMDAGHVKLTSYIQCDVVDEQTQKWSCGGIGDVSGSGKITYFKVPNIAVPQCTGSWSVQHARYELSGDPDSGLTTLPLLYDELATGAFTVVGYCRPVSGTLVELGHDTIPLPELGQSIVATVRDYRASGDDKSEAFVHVDVRIKRAR